MSTVNKILKGFLIFGIFGFTLFVVIVLMGMIMSMFGIGCKCWEIFAWSLIGAGILSGLIVWYGCCTKGK
jgi:hypothetical protein